MGGISFKSIDPQYYKFKRLCEKAERNVTDKGLYENHRLDEIYSTYPPNEKIQSRITKKHFEIIHKPSNKIFYKYETYFYDGYGLWLKGDEGAGLWLINRKTLRCDEPEISYKDIK